MPKIICPNVNCGYSGKPRLEGKGSVFVFVLLLLLFFPLGIIYGLLNSDARYFCPNCGIQTGEGKGSLSGPLTIGCLIIFIVMMLIGIYVYIEASRV